MGAEKFENGNNVDSSMTAGLYTIATTCPTRIHLWSCSNPPPPRDRQTAPQTMKVTTGLSRFETNSPPTRDRRDAAQAERDASAQATLNRYPSGSGQPEARKAAGEGGLLSGCSNAGVERRGRGRPSGATYRKETVLLTSRLSVGCAQAARCRRAYPSSARPLPLSVPLRLLRRSCWLKAVAVEMSGRRWRGRKRRQAC